MRLSYPPAWVMRVDGDEGCPLVDRNSSQGEGRAGRVGLEAVASMFCERERGTGVSENGKERTGSRCNSPVLLSSQSARTSFPAMSLSICASKRLVYDCRERREKKGK